MWFVFDALKVKENRPKCCVCIKELSKCASFVQVVTNVTGEYAEKKRHIVSFWLLFYRLCLNSMLFTMTGHNVVQIATFE